MRKRPAGITEETKGMIDFNEEKMVPEISDEGLRSGETVAKLARKYEEYTIDFRRQFHEYPELGGFEKETSAAIINELESMGIPYEMAGEYGIVAEISGPGEGKTIALRADMDALPIQEDPSNLKGERLVVSKIAGVSHMCGHDAHTAMLLGSAKALVEIKDKLNGTVLLLFEQNEECTNPEVHGAEDINKVLADKDVDGIFGMHIWPSISAGKVSVQPGPRMAAMSLFEVTVKGKGGHGSAPHYSNDPILAAADIITSLQKIQSKSVNTLDPGIINVCMNNAGTSFNIIPDEAKFGGNIRYFDREVGELIIEELKRIATHVAKAHRCTVDINTFWGIGAAVYNNENMSAIASESVRKALGEQYLATEIPVMGSETFSLYLPHRPGLFGFLGIANEEIGTGANIHSSRYDIDESALRIGVTLSVQFAFDFLIS